jgi:hypothetical protein
MNFIVRALIKLGILTNDLVCTNGSCRSKGLFHIEMYGNSVPAGAVGGDLFEHINFQQRYDFDARIQRAVKLSKEFLESLKVVSQSVIRLTTMWNG